MSYTIWLKLHIMTEHSFEMHSNEIMHIIPFNIRDSIDPYMSILRPITTFSNTLPH
jgi:hypothetical protein